MPLSERAGSYFPSHFRITLCIFPAIALFACSGPSPEKLEAERVLRAIDSLRDGDRILVAEGCTHHPSHEDIGRVKLPRMLTRTSNARLLFEHVQGRDFPKDPGGYALVVHCGNCMGTRREMQGRIRTCQDAGTPVTNYGLAIAYSLGILERALEPFPAAAEELHAVAH